MSDKFRILIVDDDKRMAKTLKDILIIKGCEADVAYSGPEVLVTGYREEMSGAVEAALKISAYTCPYKPFEIEELLQLLSEIHRQELARILGRPVGKRK